MRKQLLLGSTALVVGALAAPDFAAAEEPLRLQVRGYKNEYFVIGDVDDSPVKGAGRDFSNTGEFSDGEVQFRGETALDNGLTVGVYVELESNSAGDQIDENFIFVKGDFGKIVMGSENLSNYNTFWGVVAPNVGTPINSGWITVFVPAPAGSDLGFRSPGLSTNITVGNDENSVSYYSPRFGGFQFTAGYAPAVVDSGDGKTYGGIEANEGSEYSNGWGVGLNFSNSFNGVDISAAVAYNGISVPDDRAALGADDVEQFKAGLGLGFGGFSIGGSYANESEGKTSITSKTTPLYKKTGGGGLVFVDDDGNGVPDTSKTSSLNSNEGQSYDVGVSYSTGPWGVSATYFHGEEEGDTTVSGDDEIDAIVGAVRYTLGPGITTSLSIMHVKFEEESGDETEATLGIVGLSVKF